MAVNKDIEGFFFSVLKEDCNREEIKQRIKDFQGDDWQRLYDTAIKNGLFCIFYTRLLSLKLKDVPSEFLTKLKYLYLWSRERNNWFLKNAFKIISLFKEADIPVIPLKGPFLAKYLYNDLALRPTLCDLDLLVPKEHLKDAENILEGYGYKTDEKKSAGFHKFRGQITFFKRNSKEASQIDLHWTLRDKFVPEHTQNFWQNIREFDVDGYKILFPSNEDLLLYLVLLLIFDEGYIQINYLYDLHCLVARFSEDIDWQVLAERAKKLNLIPALFLSLKLSQDIFNTNLAQSILDNLRPAFLRRLIGSFWINKTKVLKFRRKIAFSYPWRYAGISYFRSRNFFDCLRIIYKKIFLPMEEVMWLYNRPMSEVSYRVYIERLLRPLSQSQSP